ncbi:MAG: M20/M25/M40 family metallo-hydrolase [Clostridiales bacterium]|nr:M20/M25/M40 family metallo-hydrolase [Clostridiales bacterium]
MFNIKVMEELSNAFGPSGFEDDVADVIKKYSQGLEFEGDSMNNVYTRLYGNKGDRPVIMIDCHLDEVGFMVQSITSKGLIRFLPIGGWVVTNIPAHAVIIKNSKGELIRGITTSRPPHFMTVTDREKKLDLDDIYIDVGAISREEVINDFGIEPGDPVVPDVSFRYNEKNGILFGKAFDDRVGCFCLIEIMQKLKKENLDIDVVGAFAAQEEVGARGAEVTARCVKPDLAIVIEGSPADDIYYDEYAAQGCLKKGTQIRHIDRSMVSNPHFIRFAKELANDKNIAYQSAVRAQGGTNAGKIHVANKGVPTLVLGIPVRYAHTHYCYCAMFDIDATVNLATSVIKNLSSRKIGELLKQI